MTLESFTKATCYKYITDQKFQNIFRAAGLSLNQMPDTPMRTLALEYGYLVKNNGGLHEEALYSLGQRVVQFQPTTTELKALPVSYQGLAHKFAELKQRSDLLELGHKLLLNPTQATMDSYRQHETSHIIDMDAAEMIRTYHPIINLKAESGEAIIKINGFELLSDLIGGFNPARIGLLMAETGFGKTNLGVNLAIAAAETMPVGYVNMEMSFDDITKRLVTRMAGRDFNDVNAGNVFLDETQRAADKVKGKLRFTNGKTLSLTDIKVWSRMLSETVGLKLLIVDYDQKLDLSYDKGVQEWKAMQNAIIELEELAKQLECFVLLMSQTNRAGEISSSFRATFSAHCVLDFTKHEMHGPLISTKKNRHGPRGFGIKMTYDAARSTVMEHQRVNLEMREDTAPAREEVPIYDTPNYAPQGVPYADN